MSPAPARAPRRRRARPADRGPARRGRGTPASPTRTFDPPPSGVTARPHVAGRRHRRDDLVGRPRLEQILRRAADMERRQAARAALRAVTRSAPSARLNCARAIAPPTSVLIGPGSPRRARATPTAPRRASSARTQIESPGLSCPTYPRSAVITRRDARVPAGRLPIGHQQDRAVRCRAPGSFPSALASTAGRDGGTSSAGAAQTIAHAIRFRRDLEPLDQQPLQYVAQAPRRRPGPASTRTVASATGVRLAITRLPVAPSSLHQLTDGKHVAGREARPATPPIALGRCVARLPKSGRHVDTAAHREIPARARPAAAERRARRRPRRERAASARLLPPFSVAANVPPTDRDDGRPTRTAASGPPA